VQAVESLNKICEELSQQQIEENFIPLVLRLSKADWFTSKISATGLYQTPYTRATPPSQEALRQHYGQLVHDDTPMVRRQAANNLAKFIKAMPPSIVIDEMIPLFQHLAADDQDSVRLLTVDILIAIAEAVPKEQQSSHGVLLTALRSLFEDKSWRVRYMVADRFEKVRSACSEGKHALMGLDCESRRRGGCQPRPCTRLCQATQGHRGRGAQRHCRTNSRYVPWQQQVYSI
jgi:serine/threonine-protein phosphatase 2A regulatory subunit A